MAALGCTVLLLAASFASGVASDAGASTRANGPSPRTALPQADESGSALPTSVTTVHGTWAAIPMGRLDDPLNTFWQLFYRAANSTRWMNEASALSIATNGGILLAGPESGSLLVAVRPTNKLQFTAFVSFSNGASDPVVVPPIDGVVEQVAAGPDGRRAALVGTSTGTAVEEAASAGAGWSRRLTVAALASSSTARACGPMSISAVGYAANGALLVGAACREPGVVGLFRAVGDAWQRVEVTGPRLTGTVGVAEIRSTAAVTTAVFTVSSPNLEELVVATEAPTSALWHTSPALVLPTDARLTSLGSMAAGGQFVLGATPTGARFGDVLAGSTGLWVALPSLPVGTETLATPPGGAITALAGVGSTMHSYLLVRSPTRWVSAGSVSVDILYGSSS